MSTSGANVAAGGRTLVVLSTVKQRYYIVARGSGRCQTQVLRVAQHSGKLQFTRTKGQDIFDSEAYALEHIKAVDGPIQTVASAPYILGYVVIGPWGLLLLAEKFRVSAVLPGNHEVKSITKVQWLKIPLQINISMQSVQAPEVGTKDEKAMKDEIEKGIERLMAFPVEGAHFLCDTLDITRPFPSYRAIKEPSWDFVWNRWMSAPFRNLGLDHLCPPLLQGLCESRVLEDFDNSKYMIAVISRRGCLHPGPRYKARGLNDYAEPGNELEVEQVIWRHRNKDGSLLWSRYTWRRGSAPLWWGVSIKNNGIGEAEIKIRQTRTFKGSKRYVRRLQQRYIPNPQLDPDPPETGMDGDPSRLVPVAFVSLLRKGLPDRDRSEAKLASAFDFVAAQLRKEHGMNLTYIALDWHEMDKQLGHTGIVEAFWNTVKDVIPAQGFALGILEKVGPDHTEVYQDIDRPSASGSRVDDGTGIMGSRVSAAGIGWRAHWIRQQRGVTRYNCADSLDRTNVGSFFGAVQVLIEQCRELDIAIARNRSANDQLALQMGRGARDPRTMVRLTPSSVSTAFAGISGGTGSSAQHGTSAGSYPFAGVTGGGTAISSAMAAGNSLFTGGRSIAAGAMFEKIGKQVATGLNTIMQPLATGDVRSPIRTSAASLPGSQTPIAAGQSTGRASPLPRSQAAAVNTPPPSTSTSLSSSVDALQRRLTIAPDGLPLPPGWEAKIDKTTNRTFYVDHNSRSTTWDRPPVPASGRLSSDSLSAGFQPGSGPSSVIASSAPASSGHVAEAHLRSQGVELRASNTSNSYSQGGGMAAAVSTPRGVLGQSAESPGDSFGQQRLGPSTGGQHQRTDSGDSEERFEPLTPWCMLRTGKVATVSRRIHPDALSVLAELFLINGDMCAWLYTGSQAMHSERILIFEPDTSKLRKAGVGAYGNAIVAFKRRYNNVLVDKEKQQMIDVFLGYKQLEYFPSSWLAYRVPDNEMIPLEGDEVSDMDTEPVGQINWPLPERNTVHLHHLFGMGAGSGFPAAVTSMSLSMASVAGTPAPVGAAGDGLTPVGSALGHVHSAGDLVASSGAHPGSVQVVNSRLSRRGKSMSTEELAEQLRQIHLHSQQVDEKARAYRKAGSEAALVSMDSTNSVDLINFGGAESETSSVASASGSVPVRPVADGAGQEERTPVGTAAPSGTGATPPQTGSMAAGFSDWANFDEFNCTATPRPSGSSASLQPPHTTAVMQPKTSVDPLSLDLLL